MVVLHMASRYCILGWTKLKDKRDTTKEKSIVQKEEEIYEPEAMTATTDTSKKSKKNLTITQ